MYWGMRASIACPDQDNIVWVFGLVVCFGKYKIEHFYQIYISVHVVHIFKNHYEDRSKSSVTPYISRYLSLQTILK